MTPEQLEIHLEEAELVGFLEKHSVRCLTEATRQTTRLQTEQRQLRSQSYRLSTYGWLTDETIDQVFVMHDKSPQQSAQGVSAGQRTTIDEKTTADLWTLRRVLEALKFPLIEEALSHIAELAVRGNLAINTDLLPGLVEAFQWYARRTDADGLPDYDNSASTKEPQSGDQTPQPTFSGERILDVLHISIYQTIGFHFLWS